MSTVAVSICGVSIILPHIGPFELTTRSEAEVEMSLLLYEISKCFSN